MPKYRGEIATISFDHPKRSAVMCRCDYCGRYGALGSCEGCGAPNRPTADEVPIGLIGYADQIEVTTFGDTRRKFIPVCPSNRLVKG